jgi:hypothetical protein
VIRGLTAATPLALALLATAQPAWAQTWRSITSSRQTHGESELSVEVEYSAGNFRLAPGVPGTLYRMEMRYDEERFAPLREYDAGSGVLRLGVRSRGGARVSLGDRRRSPVAATLDLALTPDIPISLDLALGAVQSDVELGGLALRRLRYRTGASESRLGFSRPNPVACEELIVEAGAAEFEATELANSNCRSMVFRGGVGEISLDFSGEWRQAVDAEVNVSIGSLTLTLPREVGVAIRVNRFLASFASAGFTKRGNAFYSANYEAARHRLNLRVNATIGDIDVAWTSR